MEKNEVNEAFEILLEEIEGVANALNETGAEAFRAGDYEKARQAIEEATLLAEFREKIRALQKEWLETFAASLKGRKRSRRERLSRLPRGLRTPKDAFRIPILEALVEFGESAPLRDVLDLVEQKIKGVLKQHDYESLASDPTQLAGGIQHNGADIPW